MAQLSDDCFAFGGALTRVDAALADLLPRLAPVTGIETVALDAAPGRVLAEDIVAGRSVPPHDNAAVDGYAVHFDDLADDRPTVLPVVGRIAAGHPLDGGALRGRAYRIFTGAPMPAGPDTVLMQEDCRRDGDRVEIPPGIRRGANRRRAGEDVTAGSIILRAGRRLRPQDIGLAASVGLAALPVRRRLSAALFSTGDEVREPGTPAPPGCIYDANRHTLAALLSQLGCEVGDLGILPDDPGAIRAAIERAAAAHDVIVTSGGVSGGGEDHVKQAMEAAGGRLHSWRLAIKPGRPVALGQVGLVPFLGLPGNPVAVMVTFLQIARPILLALGGAAVEPPPTYPVTADFEYRKKRDRREYVRVILRRDAPDALPVAVKHPRDGAGVLSSMVEADGLVELDEERTVLERGETVSFLPFSGIL